MFRIAVFLIPSVFIFLAGCGNRLIRKDAVAQINEHYSEKIYYLTKDKKVSNTRILKRDARSDLRGIDSFDGEN